jgi:hypothetical protein
MVFEVGTIVVALAIKPDVAILAAFTTPVWYAPVVLAIKLEPTVNNEVFTDTDTFAAPVTTKATSGAVLLIPTLLLVASTNNTPESKLAFPDIVCRVPLRVVFPATTNCKSVSIVVVEITVLTVVFPIDTLLVMYKTLDVVVFPPLRPKVVLPLTVTELAVKIPLTVPLPVVSPP